METFRVKFCGNLLRNVSKSSPIFLENPRTWQHPSTLDVFCCQIGTWFSARRTSGLTTGSDIAHAKDHIADDIPTRFQVEGIRPKAQDGSWLCRGPFKCCLRAFWKGKLGSMELKRAICEDLKIPWHYMNVKDEDRALCLVHKSWLQKLLSSHALPTEFPRHERMSDVECDLLLQQLEYKESGPWRVLEVHSIEKQPGKLPRLPKMQQMQQESDLNLSYYQLLRYISETNYRNLWKEAYKANVANSCDTKLDAQEKLQPFCTFVREALHRLFACPFICLHEEGSTGDAVPADVGPNMDGMPGCHQNILPALCLAESSRRFYVLQAHLRYSVHDGVTFSPAIFGHSNNKPLFLVYQLLHAVRDLHDRGLGAGDLGLADLRIDANLWVQVRPRVWQGALGASEPPAPRPAAGPESPSGSPAKLGRLAEGWVRGEVSNFDYLMALNRLAGRRLGDPNYHPVLPWVMDFTLPDGGWRELAKSKFRLNKGDRQLDLTYEALPSAHVVASPPGGQAPHVPHHVSDVLSEITFYVYKARQTPRAVLCQYVRSHWVPAEYPSSMQRLYEWTPDECIPEFYTDATIFSSVHEDLPDLEVPWWAASAEDFVARHRAALDGPHVSERLHHWIDLTFGFKLSGPAAVKAKNVCLHVVDQHTTLTSGGVVQLFTQPHPYRLGPSPYLNPRPPSLFRAFPAKDARVKESAPSDAVEPVVAPSSKDLADGEFDYLAKFLERRRASTRPKSILVPAEAVKPELRPECHPIILPKDYASASLARLNQLETLCNFTAKTTFRELQWRQGGNQDKVHIFHDRKVRDMVAIGCLIVELFLGSKLRALDSTASLEDRYRLICAFLQNDFFELPRCTRHAVNLLLQLGPAGELSSLDIPKRMPAVTAHGLPPPSAHQLLQPLIQILPFPPYFLPLYAFLHRMKRCKEAVAHEQLLQGDAAAVERLAEAEVKTAAAGLHGLLPQLNDEGLDLLVPYLKEMFESPPTAIQAAWYLFNLVGRALGPALTGHILIEPLARLFDPESPTSKHIKLFHRSYLLQLIVRLGLQTFLAFFTTLLIEAAGGLKDFGCDDVKRPEVRDLTRKGSHLRSPELESLAQDTEPRDTECTLSPFDENSSQTEIASPWNRSESENVEASAMTDQDMEAEPEIFVFDSAGDDFIGEDTARVETETDLLVQLEQKYGGNSSDSTSADALSIGEPVTDLASSPTIDDDSHLYPTPSKMVCYPEPDAGSFSEGCPIPAGKSRRRTLDSELYSSSVPASGASFPGPRGRALSSSAEDPPFAALRDERLRPKGSGHCNISDVATESIIWLAHRLGPVLTAKHLSRNLLRMLSLCYLGAEQLEMVARKAPGEPQNGESAVTISPRQLAGGQSARRVIECLTSIASLYGEHFILLQYFPHMIEVVAQSKRRITGSCEAALVGNMVLIHHIVPYLSDSTLMDHLQDTIIKEIMYPVVRLIAAQRLSFPSGATSRQAIAYSFLDALYLISLRIGFEMTRKHLTPILQRFFKVFSRVHVLQGSEPPKDIGDQATAAQSHIGRLKSSYDSISPPMSEKDGPSDHSIAKEELASTFTPELAYTAYISFSKLAGSIHMGRSLSNDDLIRQLCLLHDKILNAASPVPETTPQVEVIEPPQLLSQAPKFEKGPKLDVLENVSVIGNRIEIHLDEEELVPAGVVPVVTSPSGDGTIKVADYPKCDITKLISKQMNNCHRHLKGNWFAYWEHEIGRSEKDPRFNFKQIKLQTFAGHCNSIRTIHALDNENSFISGSKDKTVKLWSLRSSGDGSAHTSCQWTYHNHKKSVFSVTFLESLRYVASCDSTVHVWDPFMGTCIKQLDSTKNSPVTVLLAMPAPSTVMISATTEGSIRFMDVRTLRYMHEYKVSLGSAGLIRCLAVSPNGLWVAVGHSSGIISILDARTGLMSSTWKGHEGEVLQIKAFNSSTFVTSSLDQCVSVWNADDGKLRCYLRGPTEPVHCFNFYKNEMISGTTANRIGVHTSIDSQASFSSTRLRADTFKGVLTCLTVLPQNRLLLLGADNGAIRLLC